MSERRELDLIHIVWEGPITVPQAGTANADGDCGIYQIYGSHDVSGPDTLLYIGQADRGSFAARIIAHDKKWARWNPGEIKIYLGRLAGVSPITNQLWGGLIDRAEAVLIYKIAPPYNSERVTSLNHSDPILVLNHGHRHRLPECVCTVSEFINTDDPGFKVFGSSGHPTSGVEPVMLKEHTMNGQQAEDSLVGPPRSSRPLPIEPYGWHLDADVRKAKAMKVIREAWRAHKSGAMPYDHCYQRLRDPLLWDLSNCECLAVGSASSNTDFRFMTEAAYDLCDPAGENSCVGLQHEHVFQRKEMAIEILKCATEEDVEKIIVLAVACIVTKEEHRQLENFKHFYGWERYHAAGLKVVERQRTERPGRRPRK